MYLRKKRTVYDGIEQCMFGAYSSFCLRNQHRTANKQNGSEAEKVTRRYLGK